MLGDGYTDALLLEATGACWWPSFGEVSLYAHTTPAPPLPPWPRLSLASSSSSTEACPPFHDLTTRDSHNTTTKRSGERPSSRSTATLTADTECFSPTSYSHARFQKVMQEDPVAAATARRIFFAAMTDSAMPTEMSIQSPVSCMCAAREEEGDAAPTSSSSFSYPPRRSAGLSRLGRTTFHLTATWYIPPSSSLSSRTATPSSSFLSSDNPSSTSTTWPSDSLFVKVKNPFLDEEMFLKVLQCPAGIVHPFSLPNSPTEKERGREKKKNPNGHARTVATRATKEDTEVPLSLAELALQHRIRITPACPPLSSGVPRDSSSLFSFPLEYFTSSFATQHGEQEDIALKEVKQKEEKGENERMKERKHEKRGKERKGSGGCFRPCACFSSSLHGAPSSAPLPCVLEAIRGLQPQGLAHALDTLSGWLNDFTHAVEQASTHEMAKETMRSFVKEEKVQGKAKMKHPSHSPIETRSSSFSSLLAVTISAPSGVGKEMCLSYLYHQLTRAPPRFPLHPSLSMWLAASSCFLRGASVAGVKAEGRKCIMENTKRVSHDVLHLERQEEDRDVQKVISSLLTGEHAEERDRRREQHHKYPKDLSGLPGAVSYYVADYRSLHLGSLLAMEAQDVIHAIAQVCQPLPITPLKLVRRSDPEIDNKMMERKEEETEASPDLPPAAASSSSSSLSPSSSSSATSPFTLCIPMMWITLHEVDLLLPDASRGKSSPAAMGFHSAVCWELIHQLDLLSQRRLRASVTEEEVKTLSTGSAPTSEKTTTHPTASICSTLTLSIPTPVVVWSLSTVQAPPFLLSAGQGREGDTSTQDGMEGSSLHALASVALLSRLCSRGATASIFLTPPTSFARLHYRHVLSLHIRSFYYYYYYFYEDGTVRRQAAEKQHTSRVRSRRLAERKDPTEDNDDVKVVFRSSPPPLPPLFSEHCAPAWETWPVHVFCARMHQHGDAYWESTSLPAILRRHETPLPTAVEKREEGKECDQHSPPQEEVKLVSLATEEPHAMDSSPSCAPVNQSREKEEAHGEEAQEKHRKDVLLSSPVPEPFASFFGVEEVIASLQARLVWPLSHLALLQQFSIPCVKGTVICGPSGCGKTSLLAALAQQLQQLVVEPPPPPPTWERSTDTVEKGEEERDAALQGTGTRMSSSMHPPSLAPPVPLFHVMVKDALTLVEKEVGKSEENIAALFQEARAKAPTVLFLDNLDAIASPRAPPPPPPPAVFFSSMKGKDGEKEKNSHGFSATLVQGESSSSPPPPAADTSHKATDRMLSTLLVEMDGLHAHTTSVPPTSGGGEDRAYAAGSASHSVPPLVVLISSAPSLHHLDPAVYRPGRLDVHLWVAPPPREVCAKVMKERLKPILFTDEASPIRRWMEKKEEGFTMLEQGAGETEASSTNGASPSSFSSSSKYSRVMLEVRDHLHALVECRYGPAPLLAALPPFPPHRNTTTASPSEAIPAEDTSPTTGVEADDGAVSTTAHPSATSSSSPAFSFFASPTPVSSTMTTAEVGKDEKTRNIRRRFSPTAPDVLADIRDVILSLLSAWQSWNETLPEPLEIQEEKAEEQRTPAQEEEEMLAYCKKALDAAFASLY